MACQCDHFCGELSQFTTWNLQLLIIHLHVYWDPFDPLCVRDWRECCKREASPDYCQGAEACVCKVFLDGGRMSLGGEDRASSKSCLLCSYPLSPWSRLSVSWSLLNSPWKAAEYFCLSGWSSWVRGSGVGIFMSPNEAFLKTKPTVNIQKCNVQNRQEEVSGWRETTWEQKLEPLRSRMDK